MSAGNASAIYDLQREFIVANGGAEAPYLQGLTDALTRLVPAPG